MLEARIGCSAPQVRIDSLINPPLLKQAGQILHFDSTLDVYKRQVCMRLYMIRHRIFVVVMLWILNDKDVYKRQGQGGVQRTQLSYVF